MRPSSGKSLPVHQRAEIPLSLHDNSLQRGTGFHQSRVWKRFRRHHGAQCGAIFLVLFLLLGLGAPWFAPYDPSFVNIPARLKPPSAPHWFGTDHLGRDLLSRVIYGARLSVVIGLVSVGIAVLGGVPLGMIAGYYRGRIDRAIIAVIDFLLSFPPLLLAILVTALFGPGLFNAMIAIGISQVPTFARLMRGEFMQARNRLYVEAAQAIGETESRIILRHVLPNTLAPIIVQGTLNFASAILSASYLGFLGLGAQPPTPEWGTMLSDGRRYLRIAPHVSVYPGITIMITVLAFNLFGDGLRDALDPRLSR